MVEVWAGGRVQQASAFCVGGSYGSALHVDDGAGLGSTWGRCTEREELHTISSPFCMSSELVSMTNVVFGVMSDDEVVRIDMVGSNGTVGVIDKFGSCGLGAAGDLKTSAFASLPGV